MVVGDRLRWKVGDIVVKERIEEWVVVRRDIVYVWVWVVVVRVVEGRGM